MPDRIRPVAFKWTGEHMEPLPRFRGMAKKQYVVGEEYPLTPVEHRSMASHNHFFAAVSETWKNLPEKFANITDPETGEIYPRYPTADHLRKWALVQVGYAQHRVIVCDSIAHAKEAAATARLLDEYAVIRRRRETVHIWVAASQATHNMPHKQDFETSKRAVLDLLASMIQVPRSQLSAEAERISGRKEAKPKTRFN